MYPSRPTHSASKTRMNTAIEVAAKRGKTGTALSAIESQKKARAALVEERNDSERTIRWLIALTRRAFAAHVAAGAPTSQKSVHRTRAQFVCFSNLLTCTAVPNRLNNRASQVLRIGLSHSYWPGVRVPGYIRQGNNCGRAWLGCGG